MRERPILFRPQLVQRIRAGAKTETRRLGDRQPAEVGDRLWVRTTWATTADLDELSPSDIGKRAVDAGYERPWAPVWWQAGGYNHAVPLSQAGPRGRWRPSIHMPRWACADVLEVMEVRREPLHAITRLGILAEGVGTPRLSDELLREAWVDVWDEINGSRGPWAANPLVWVVRFRRLLSEVTP